MQTKGKTQTQLLQVAISNFSGCYLLFICPPVLNHLFRVRSAGGHFATWLAAGVGVSQGREDTLGPD